ncbi:one-helix protein 2 [Striga hermonthica]|uniref:One-helix protein 2 n=1 Tax=Striga hermonthica TaxID=68872 RepID=A0A9N7MPW8_STRHE|nr:one-helix protein 2 [Striga hermonthica]
MSVVTSPSFQRIRLPNPSSPSPSSYSAYSPSSSSSFKFTIRSSQAEGPLRRPAAPAPVKPVPPSPSPPDSPPAASPPPKPAAAAAVGDKSAITLEFQRQKAKELQEYFKQKKLEEADQSPFFGFIGKNEISNGR